MFRHIIIPLDFSEKNASAIEMAASLVDRDEGHITLLHVIEVIKDIPEKELRDFYDRLEAWADQRFEQAKPALQWRGIATDSVTIYGKRAEEIVNFATQNEGDLIVMSSHQLKPEAPTRLWPTISHKVALISPLPILLVR